MKVLLIRYHNGENINNRFPEELVKKIGVIPPLGLAYMAAVLEKKHEVKILDCVALNLTKTETSDKIKEFNPDIVGVTTMTDSIKGVLEAARLAKDLGKIVVIGGPGVAANPKEILTYDVIDYGIVGDGEYSLLELVNAIEKKSKMKKVKGLVYREGDEVIENPSDVVKDIDALPYPARHLLENEKYSVMTADIPMLTIISSRGCPFNCAYCFGYPNRKFYRGRDPKKFVDEMEMLVKKYKAKTVMIVDDALTVERKRIESICNEILKRKLKVKWEAPTRIDCVDKELIQLMAKAGCIRLRYGVESGDPEILKSMNKAIKLDRVKEVFKWTKEAKIESFAYFIIGYLNETPKTMMNTINFAKQLEPDLLMFNIATPLPRTKLYDQAREAGIIKSDYWSEYILGKRNDRVPYLIKDAQKWLKKAHMMYYFRPSYILKRLMMIKSARELKNYVNAAVGLILLKKKE